MSYLTKPMSIRQSEILMKFLMMLLDLDLISEATFADTSPYFDEYILDMKQLSWEAPQPDWVL